MDDAILAIIEEFRTHLAESYHIKGELHCFTAWHGAWHGAFTVWHGAFTIWHGAHSGTFLFGPNYVQVADHTDTPSTIIHYADSDFMRKLLQLAHRILE